jgi:hypothetical protein
LRGRRGDRAIDEVMGHRSSRQMGERGSDIGTQYRHTTREMETRIARAIDECLGTAQRVAAEPWPEADAG